MSDYSALPQDLKDLARWMVYRLEPKFKDGKPVLSKKTGKQKMSKAPRAASNPAIPSDPTNPNNWCSFDEAIKTVRDVNHKLDGIGIVLGDGLSGTDFDECFEKYLPTDFVLERVKALDTYTEFSQSREGLHSLHKSPSLPAAKSDDAEFYCEKRFFVVTGSVFGDPKPIRDLSLEEITAHRAAILAHKNAAKASAVVTTKSADQRIADLYEGKWQENYQSQSEADLSLCALLLRKFGNPSIVDKMFRASGLMREKWNTKHGEKTYGEMTLEKALSAVRSKPGREEIDPDTWREGCKSFGQLSTALPRFLLSGLVPAKALTALCAPSYNCKTWFALAQALAISTGKCLWCFGGPGEPVPCIYHVPEMNEAFVRQYMAILGFGESEMFLVRPMEVGLWPLDDPRMLRSAEGRMVFLDTAGYFNPADDASSYQQSLDFAKLVFNLIQAGAEGVEGLFHPPKYAKQEDQEWTLENSILGSAGYGGILRSCLRMENRNKDKNDPNVWVYVEGMKNPGLKPFQLEGPVPLKMKVPPGESPYRRDLDEIDSDPRKAQAFAGFAAGKLQKDLVTELKVSKRELSRWRKEWEDSSDSKEQQETFKEFGEPL